MIEKWIEELKVGDKFVTEQYMGSGLDVNVITKITQKQIVTGRARFWKEHGRMVGCSGFHSTFMKPLNSETKLILMQQRVQNLAHKLDYSKIEFEPLSKIYTALVGVSVYHLKK